jgi:hypothetical protein
MKRLVTFCFKILMILVLLDSNEEEEMEALDET